MSEKVGDLFIIEGQADGICEMCGKLDELRPYGPKGENVCFDCAMKDEEAAKQKFIERMNGPSEVTKQ
jgi:hypothetical protein